MIAAVGYNTGTVDAKIIQQRRVMQRYVYLAVVSNGLPV